MSICVKLIFPVVVVRFVSFNKIYKRSQWRIRFRRIHRHPTVAIAIYYYYYFLLRCSHRGHCQLQFITFEMTYLLEKFIRFEFRRRCEATVRIDLSNQPIHRLSSQIFIFLLYFRFLQIRSWFRLGGTNTGRWFGIKSTKRNSRNHILHAGHSFG